MGLGLLWGWCVWMFLPIPVFAHGAVFAPLPSTFALPAPPIHPLLRTTCPALPAAAAPLEGYPPTAWVAFDRVMVVKDVYTGGVRTFLARQDAHLFRKMLYAQASPPPPGGRVGLDSCHSRVASEAATVLWTIQLSLPSLPAPACLQNQLPPPALRSPVPRVITFQRKRANRRVVNEPELLAMLAEFGEVSGLVVQSGAC